MSQTVVFDIETYRPDWRVRRSRREDLDPAKNTVTTVGFFDGEAHIIYPTIRHLKEEERLIQFFLEKIREFEGSTLVGYNILHFDIPYLVYKSKSMGKDFDITQFKPLDLYWILPYWLHNIPTGKTFINKLSHLGNLWRFDNVVRHILKGEPNPISNRAVLQFWEEKKFEDIEKHLKLDLTHTFSFLKSPSIEETLKQVQKQNFDKSHCKDSCPFRQPLQKTPYTAIAYCTLLQEPVSGGTDLSAIDVIDYPLPGWDISWVPCCLE